MLNYQRVKSGIFQLCSEAPGLPAAPRHVERLGRWPGLRPGPARRLRRGGGGHRRAGEGRRVAWQVMA